MSTPLGSEDASLGSELQSELDGLQRELAAIFSDKQPPEERFHYTSAEGLIGIATQGVVRGTNLSYVNDASELGYGYNLLRRYLQAQTRGGTRGAAELAQASLGILARSVGVVDVYAFCLTERSDQLSQWRAYAHHGTGYCLGIPTPEIAHYAARESSAAPTLVRVIYDPKQQEAAISAAFQGILRLKGLAESLEKTTGRPLSLEATAFLFVLAASKTVFTFKDEAFAEEIEWRFVKFLPAESYFGVKFGVKDNQIIPYTEMRLFERPDGGAYVPISSVCVGARSEPLRAERAVRALLNGHGHSGASIRRSMIPMR